MHSVFAFVEVYLWGPNCHVSTINRVVSYLLLKYGYTIHLVAAANRYLGSMKSYPSKN